MLFPFSQAKSFESAIADCTACLAVNSTYFNAFRPRARSHLAQEDWEAAVTDFKQAYDLAPEGSNDEAQLKKEVREAEQKLKRSKMKVRPLRAHSVPSCFR
jgi:DnaJ family protein C protein 7